MPNHHAITAAVIALAALAACERKTPDTAPPENARDAAGNETLAREIIVDPGRASKRASSAGGCDFAYDLAWSRRLPAALPLYPGAKVVEAAGSDAAGCVRRVVSFIAPVPPAQVVDFYRSHVSTAGYSAEHLVKQGKDVLGGTKGDAAYYLTVAPTKGGTAVDLVVNGG